MPRVSYTKELLAEAVSKSKTNSDTLRCLGMCPSGGSQTTLKKYIKKWGIDASHFIGSAATRGPSWRRKTLDEILCEHSLASRSTIKARLYQTGLKQRTCEMCGQGETWNGKKMSLILDHINGVRDDSRIENLRILCPNCNSTLDTHCGKHLAAIKPPKRSEIDPLWRRRPKPSLRKVLNRPKREALIKAVAEHGYCEVARRYGVTDNAVRKWIATIGDDLTAG